MDPFSLLNRGDQYYNKREVTQNKVQRKFWPGQRPDQANDENEIDDDIFQDNQQDQKSYIGGLSMTTDNIHKAGSKHYKPPQPQLAPPQLPKRKIIRQEIVDEEDKKPIKIEDDKPKSPKKQQKPQQEVVVPKKVDEVEVEVSHRQRLRQRLLAEQEEEEEELLVKEKMEVEENEEIQEENLKFQQKIQQQLEKNLVQIIQEKKEDINIKEEKEDNIFSDGDDRSDQEEENDEEEIEDNKVLEKPVFVDQKFRLTTKDMIDEELILQKEKDENIKRKIEETTMLVQNAIKKDAEKKNENEPKSDQDMPDDEDLEEDDDEEYQQWKIRELKRIKEDREERDKMDKYREEMERRRNLTDEQRKEEDIRLGSDALNKKENYYHKGGFFQDEGEELYERDFNVAVPEDLIDRSNPNMPKSLQKRRGIYGKKGQSKYTHLNDQDTTNYDPNYKVDQNIQGKMFRKQAGIKGDLILDYKKKSSRK